MWMWKWTLLIVFYPDADKDDMKGSTQSHLVAHRRLDTLSFHVLNSVLDLDADIDPKTRSVRPSFIFLITSFPIFASLQNGTCLSSLRADSMDLAKAVEFPDTEAEWSTARTMLVDDDAAAL